MDHGSSASYAGQMKDVPEAKGVAEVEAKSSKRNPTSPGAIRPTAGGSALRGLTLAGATLATGLVAGVFYAYAVSVNLGLAAQTDAAYVATMNEINERIQNPLFFASFFVISYEFVTQFDELRLVGRAVQHLLA